MVAVLTLLSNSLAHKQVLEEDGYLSRSPTIKANSKIVKERIWIAFLPSHPDNGAPLHEERMIAVREEPNLHYWLYQRDVTDEMRSPWKLPIDVVSVVKVAQKLENTVQLVIGLGFHSSAMEDVDHDLLNEVRQPRTHALNRSVIDCVEKKLLSTGSTQHLYVRKSGQLFIEMSLMNKKEKMNAQLFWTHIRWRSRNVLRGFRVQASRNWW